MHINRNEFYKNVLDIELTPIEKGSSIVLNNLYFKLDSDNVFDYEKSKLELGRLITLIQTNLKMRIEIGGHTD